MGFACPILVDDGFDSIAIRVNDKCGVVMEAIVRPQTWQAMIPPTMGNRSKILQSLRRRSARCPKGTLAVALC